MIFYEGNGLTFKGHILLQVLNTFVIVAFQARYFFCESFITTITKLRLKQIQTILGKFDSVSLDEIDEVKLMNRIDRKYWFHVSLLEPLLKVISNHYHVLEINGQRLMKYHSSYFDTHDNTMYLQHHNQKLNRYKVRQRKYHATNQTFFEIKFKTNKKRTVKERIQSEMDGAGFLTPEKDFLHNKSPYQYGEMVEQLQNRFQRITLINKQKKDRCTIDISPEFWNRKGKVTVNNLVIFELKREIGFKGSPILDIMRQLGIRQDGLSKYCTGRALLDTELKQNAFKPKLRFLNKMD